ncbi:TetR/AcrR family transcriptional regulator [Pseudonocardia eucalypti]|uniref:TetR/AcrR family transcriptional regulator n=1 Tax=Pseudonocardia eucalypti TaxID=648755 RepID=A0ABP9PRF5_9PSEU|nr:AcrR family transcriptional regulator [Pseudonocardia eucalypti]
MNADAAPSPRPRRGRRRDESKDVAALEAALKLLATEGLAGFSMDRVAAAAGISKVTMYTRWPSKTELIGAALNHLQVDHVPAPTGNVRDDLVAHLEAMRVQYEESGGMGIVGNCLADEPSSGELLAIVRRSTLLPRRAHFAQVLHAGIGRGELSPDLDVERATSMLVGQLYADHLAGLEVCPGWAEAVVDGALAGLAPRA